MKQRFVSSKANSTSRNLIISIAIFMLIVCCFLYAVSFWTQKNVQQEKETLSSAINRGIVHCYAIEGSYPEDLSYLKEHYGLSYDPDRFFVDYQTLGSNIMPDVTIIEKEDRQ